jgi:hypothetical protein
MKKRILKRFVSVILATVLYVVYCWLMPLLGSAPYIATVVIIHIVVIVIGVIAITAGAFFKWYMSPD